MQLYCFRYNQNKTKLACVIDLIYKKCKFLAAENMEIKAALTALVYEVKEKNDKQMDHSQVDNADSRLSNKPSGSVSQLSLGIAKHSGLSIL